VSENRVLWGIFGPKRDEGIRDWRKPHNEEVRILLFVKYNLNDRVKGDEMGRKCNTHGEKRNACRILVGKPEGKRQLKIPRRR
jgi:hypothetical protein